MKLSTKLKRGRARAASERSIYRLCCEIPDCRSARGIRHRYCSILAISVAGVLSNCKNFRELGEWAAHLDQEQLRNLGVRKTKGIYLVPSEATLRRTLNQTDPEILDQLAGAWASKELRDGFTALACDGKWLRGSGDTGNQVKLVAALTHASAVVVGQVEVPSTSNEISVMRQLLEKLQLQGVVVTADALHTQRDFTRWLVKEKQADYVLTAKGNQRELETSIRELKEEHWGVPHTATGKGHGRVETRVTQTSVALRDYLWNTEPFPFVEQVFRISRTVTNQKTGVTTNEVAVGITSLPPERATAAAIGALVRGHWAIENQLHWSRDVVFGEDGSQIRTGSGARVMASLRNTVISLLRLRGETKLAPTLRRMARNPNLAIALVLGY